MLARRYQAALSLHIKQGSAASLHTALRLGHLAVAMKLDTLDLAMMHEQALITEALPVNSAAARNRIIDRAGKFFIEAIIPIEETHSLSLDANHHLVRLNKALCQSTQDLASSNRQLKQEVARRRVVEETLRQSEQHSNLLLEQSRLQQEQLRRLSRRIMSAQEEERKRISRELHDVIAQMLTGINVRLATLKIEASSNAGGLSKKISSTQRLVEKSVDIVHRFARELRPAVLDDLGLIPALHSFMKSYSKETGILISLKAFAGVEKLSSAKRTVLYRVAHEALANVTRHAQASQVEVNIQKLPNAVCMDISDNGKGFEPKRVLLVNKCKRPISAKSGWISVRLRLFRP